MAGTLYLLDRMIEDAVEYQAISDEYHVLPKHEHMATEKCKHSGCLKAFKILHPFPGRPELLAEQQSYLQLQLSIDHAKGDGHRTAYYLPPTPETNL